MENKRERIGIFGGTFDPVHIIHLVVADQAYHHMKLDKVYFMPAALNPFKTKNRANNIDRLTMLSLATRDNPNFGILDFDMVRGKSPTRTIDTLEDVRNYFGAAPEIFLIIGKDNFESFPKWERYQEIVQDASLIVASRGIQSVDVHMHNNDLITSKTFTMDIPLDFTNLSATYICERLALGLSVNYLVPDRALAFIYREHLYGT